jgi:hypothetical protein
MRFGARYCEHENPYRTLEENAIGDIKAIERATQNSTAGVDRIAIDITVTQGGQGGPGIGSALRYGVLAITKVECRKRKSETVDPIIGRKKN